MAFVKSQNGVASVTLGQHDDRGVCQTDLEIRELLDDLAGSANVRSRESFKAESSSLDLRERCLLGRRADSCREEIVELRQHEG